MGRQRLGTLVVLSLIALFPGLGSWSRLTYHEAFVAQGAREILQSGQWGYPTIAGLPWLEKPPLPWWLVAGLGYCTGAVTQTVARLPSALAALGLVLGVALLATPHYGPHIGLLSGAVQATTAWTVLRGRLAEADILLACLITWALVAFDRLRSNPIAEVRSDSPMATQAGRFWCWLFFVFLSGTTLVKGIGFGAVLILVVVAGTLIWERDLTPVRRLLIPGAWILAALITLAWPISMVAIHGYRVLSLWTVHVSDRLVQQEGPGFFASEPWLEYLVGLMSQTLPWTPFTLVGAWCSLERTFLHGLRGKFTRVAKIPAIVIHGDRLLWAWAVIPVCLLALAPVKNAHYVISAQVPWSIWAALALADLRGRLWFRGYTGKTLSWVMRSTFVVLALAYGLGLSVLHPWFDHRGREWAFYEAIGHQVPKRVPISLLYDDWDRDPYPSPFGRIPHDLAVRLFYLARPICWHFGPAALLTHDHIKRLAAPGTSSVLDHGVAESVESFSLAIIGRDRDLPALKQLGDVEVVARGPSSRQDRNYSLFYIKSRPAEVQSIARIQTLRND